MLPQNNTAVQNAQEIANQLMGYTGLPPKASMTFQRPDNATPYAIGDAIAQAVVDTSAQLIRVPSIMQGLTGLITGATLLSDAVLTTPQITVHIFDQPIAWAADNAAAAPTWAQTQTHVATIDFLTQRTFGTTAIFIGTISFNAAFKRTGINTTLYPYFIAANVFTPGALQNFKLTLDTI